MIEQLKQQHGTVIESHVFLWVVSVQIHMHSQQECDGFLLLRLSEACCQVFVLILLEMQWLA